MTRRLSLAISCCAAIALSGFAVGQSSRPALEKLPDPAADALQSYLAAQNANDQAGIKKLVEVSAANKKDYVTAVINFQLWSRYFEKKAIEKFGKEDGMGIQGHVRSFDDQYTLDSRRVRDANVQYNTERTTATIFLRVELNRPDNLQMDRFEFLDEYDMVKTGDGWKVDFLKTYKCLDPDQEEMYQSEQAAFPRMAKVCSELCDQLKKGTIKTADDLKNTYDEKWSHVYDDPIKHTLKPGETIPADAVK